MTYETYVFLSNLINLRKNSSEHLGSEASYYDNYSNDWLIALLLVETGVKLTKL